MTVPNGKPEARARNQAADCLRDDLARASSIAEIASVAVRAARAEAAADAATFVLREFEECYYVDEDSLAPLWKGQRFPSSICISGWVMSNRQTAVVADVSQDKRIPYNLYKPTFIKSLVMAPIGPKNPLGSIGVYWTRVGPPDLPLIAGVERIADQVAAALSGIRTG